ncbi:MAG: hypothetical protein EOO39_01430 [Cytophagaceae bacterium]|nr:MAG: hypothetical protein EOO39_01430 [Cytophagaceae bacterium]
MNVYNFNFSDSSNGPKWRFHEGKLEVTDRVVDVWAPVLTENSELVATMLANIQTLLGGGGGGAAAPARKAYQITNATSGTSITHGFGTQLGLAKEAYHLRVWAEDSDGDLIVGMHVTKTTADVATLVLTSDITPFSGVIVLEAIPLTVL